MICCVDLEHPELGPSMLSEGPEATQRQAIRSNFVRLAGFAAPRSEAVALARA